MLYGPQETERQQHQVCFQNKFSSRNRLELRRRPYADGVKLLDVSIFVAGEVRRTDGPIPQAAFFMRALRAQL